MRRHAVVLGLLLVGLGVSGCSRTSTPQIGGGGATFIEPLMNTWQPVYYKEAGVKID
jgi:ABC-type phosphate transport system substrate-binding protein